MIAPRRHLGGIGLFLLLGLLAALLPLIASNVTFLNPPPATAATDPSGSVPAGQPAQPWDCSELDWGIYWYGRPKIETHYGQEYRYVGGASRKAYPDGRPIPGFYDPAKPTVIFVHGWQNDFIDRGHVLDTSRPTWRYYARHEFEWRQADPNWNDNLEPYEQDPSQVLNIAAGWFDDGWNVGIFHWTQLADDVANLGDGGIPTNAQAKIWTINGPAGMRWKRCVDAGNPVFEEDDVPTVPVSDLFYDAYAAAFQQYSGPEVRLAGTSLGAQLAVATTHRLYAAFSTVPAAQRPTRVALLDPYWGPVIDEDYSYMPEGKAPGRLTRDYVRKLKQQDEVLFEWYTHSPVNELIFGDTNDPLVELISNTRYESSFFGGVNLGNVFDYHTAGFKLYFWSKSEEFDPPRECRPWSTPESGCKETGREAASAATSNSRMRFIMDPDGNRFSDDGGVWEQVDGRSTFTPADDTFRCIDHCPGTRVLVTNGTYNNRVYDDQIAKASLRMGTWIQPDDATNADPADTYTVYYNPAEPIDDAYLEEIDIWVVILPDVDQEAWIPMARRYVQSGGMLLLVGENPHWPEVVNTSLYEWAFGLTGITFRISPRWEQCVAADSHRLEIPFGSRAFLGLGNQDPAQYARVAAADTLIVPEWQVNPNRQAFLIEDTDTVVVAAERLGDGWVAVSGDLNIWTCDYADDPDYNQAFTRALFNWLARRAGSAAAE